ncbi:MAG: hypothetical protein ABJA78_00850 [Ferruginibacter sp.]
MKHLVRSPKMSFVIFISLTVALISCSKNPESTPTPTPPPDPTPKAATFSFTAVTPIDPQRKDTAWYGDVKQVTCTWSNADSVVINGVKINSTTGTSLTTPILTGNFAYSGTAFSKGGNASDSKTIFVYSQVRTMLCKDSPKWQMSSKTGISSTGITAPPATLDPNKYTYFPNGSFQYLNSSGNLVTGGSYSLLNNDTKYSSAVGVVWDITSLTSNRWEMTRTYNDPFTTGVTWTETIVYVTVP